MANMIYWIAAVLLFGIVITVHELGHFWAARLTGISVVEFAVGIGPKLASRKAKSGVLYSLRLLPFGGYCRFVGDEEEDGADAPDAYFKAKVWKRAMVSLGGPLMNYLAAFVMLVAIFAALGVTVGVSLTIDAVVSGSPAEEAGFQGGDIIFRVDGQAVETTDEASKWITAAGTDEIAFEVRRGEETVSLRATPRWNEAEGRNMIGIEYRGVLGTFGIVDSVKLSLLNIGEMSRMIFDLLRAAIFSGEGTKNLSGPIGTVVEVKNITQAGGLRRYLELAALISVNLGLFNMLPVPGLDGSKLIFLLIEKIRGKRLDPNKEGFVTLIGMGLLVVVMGIVMYQDIVRLIR